MPFTPGRRVTTTIEAIHTPGTINNELRMQLRLATGRRINQGTNDPSGFVISEKMEGRFRSLSTPADSVRSPQNVFRVAEDAYQKLAEILTRIKDRQVRE